MASSPYNTPIAAAGAGKGRGVITDQLLESLGSSQPDSAESRPPAPPVVRPPVGPPRPVSPTSNPAAGSTAPQAAPRTSTRPEPEAPAEKRVVRKTRKPASKHKKNALHSFDQDVLLMIERVAYHRGDSKSSLVNEVVRAALEKLPEARKPTEWE